MKILDITHILNQWAPPAYQESYDNSGLIVGNPNQIVNGILISLDCTEAVVQEAIDQGCNLIIAHHPIVFKGLKSFTGKNYVEKTVIKAIKNDIGIFSIHTNLDSVLTGVNKKICSLLNLENCKILAPKSNTLSKLVTFVPQGHERSLLKALHNAGAGSIGNYEQCSYTSDGLGHFKPQKGATPYIGEINKLQTEKETKIEVLLPSHAESSILRVLKEHHPYEEIAYYLTALKNNNQDVGSGMYGQLDTPVETKEFLNTIKDRFNLKIIKHTAIIKEKISRVAVCGGSGSFLLNQAKKVSADLFITSDFKYHEFFDTEDSTIIADIGHYESEVFTKQLIYDFLNKKITNIALNLSKENTNPINYF